MKKVLFFGHCDKSDLLLYCARIAHLLGLRTLVVDATVMQKYEWMTSAGMEPAFKLWQSFGFDLLRSTYCDADVHFALMEQRLSLEIYDLVLIDFDQIFFVDKWENIEEYVLVSSPERYCIVKNVESVHHWLHHMTSDERAKHQARHVIYRLPCTMDERYIAHVFEKYPPVCAKVSLIDWSEEDAVLKLDLAYHAALHLYKLSAGFKQSLISLMSDLTANAPARIRAVLKK